MNFKSFLFPIFFLCVELKAAIPLDITQFDTQKDLQKPLSTVDPVGWVLAENSKCFLGSSGAYDRKNLSCYDPIKKIFLWQKKLDSQISMPISVFRGKIFALLNEGAIEAFNAETGASLWKTLLDSPAVRHITRDESSLFLITTKETVYRIQQEDGKILWARDSKESLDPDQVLMSNQPAALVSHSHVFWGGIQGGFFTLDKETGRQISLWEDRIPNRQMRHFVGKFFDFQQTVIGVRHDGYIFGFSPQSQTPVWSKFYPEYGFTSADLKGQILCLGTIKGEILALNLETKEILWKNQMKSAETMISGTESAFYAASSDGTVAAFHPLFGHLLWSYYLGSGILTPPLYDIENKHLYFSTGYKNLYGFKI